MATGGVSSASNSGNSSCRRDKIHQVCRYFLHGACTKGENCRFSHDKSRAVPVDNICRYYLAGTCSYGDRCRYDHVKTKTTSNIDQSTRKCDNEKHGLQQLPLNLNTQGLPSNMVTLKKGGLEESLALASQVQEKENLDKKWTQAKEFVPGERFHGSVPSSYAQAVEPDVYGAVGGFDPGEQPPIEVSDSDLLCPYFAHGECHFDTCQYVHGLICDMCGLPRLHPTNMKQQEEHQKECLEEHTREMEIAFMVKESNEKECGICLETIKDKVGENGAPVDRRFGILENCNHCFCLPCIKEWRAKRVAEKETHRCCPVCRTHSNFVTPSEFWVEDEQKKLQLISQYKSEIGKKPCQYFKQGKGECPFYDKCFYLHALPDGSIAPPQPRPRRRRRVDEGGEDQFMEDYSLWDYLASRDDEMGDLGASLLSLDDELSLILMEAFDYDEADAFSARFRMENADFTFTDDDDDSSVSDL